MTINERKNINVDLKLVDFFECFGILFAIPSKVKRIVEIYFNVLVTQVTSELSKSVKFCGILCY